MSVVVKEMKRGAKCSLWAIGNGEVFELLEFLRDIQRQNERRFDKINALLTRTIEHGPPRNMEKSKKLTGSDGIFEFKTGDGVRILWFWDAGDIIICTHGFTKKKQKTPPREILYAETKKKEYFQAKTRGSLRIERLRI